MKLSHAWEEDLYDNPSSVRNLDFDLPLQLESCYCVISIFNEFKKGVKELVKTIILWKPAVSFGGVAAQFMASGIVYCNNLFCKTVSLAVKIQSCNWTLDVTTMSLRLAIRVYGKK